MNNTYTSGNKSRDMQICAHDRPSIDEIFTRNRAQKTVIVGTKLSCFDFEKMWL